MVTLANVNGVHHAYPHKILNWHEIVNDEINNTQIALVFCPLTGTSTVWHRTIDGVTLTYGVSGFLYNSNVVPYERVSGSNWYQMLQLSINGPLKSTVAKNLFVMETSYSTAKRISQDFKLLTTNTGFNRRYDINPYGDYPRSPSIIFSVNFEDNRLHPKERILGVIINKKAKAYRFSSFE